VDQPGSGLMLAARITLPHFSLSPATKFPNSAGVIGIGTQGMPLEWRQTTPHHSWLTPRGRERSATRIVRFVQWDSQHFVDPSEFLPRFAFWLTAIDFCSVYHQPVLIIQHPDATRL
jgi:hypothetical protein